MGRTPARRAARRTGDFSPEPKREESTTHGERDQPSISNGPQPALVRQAERRFDEHRVAHKRQQAAQIAGGIE
jgi:hypothetical protein